MHARPRFFSLEDGHRDNFVVGAGEGADTYFLVIFLCKFNKLNFEFFRGSGPPPSPGPLFRFAHKYMYT